MTRGANLSWVWKAEKEFKVVSIQLNQLEVLQQYSDDSGETLLSAILALYLKDTPKAISKLRAAFSGNDHMNVRKIAHSLRSSSAHVGAVKLASFFEKLELDCNGEKALDVGDAKAALAAVEEEFSNVTRDLTVIHLLANGKDVPAEFSKTA